MNDKKIIGGEYRIDTDVMNKKIKNTFSPHFSLGRTCLYAILDAVKSKVGGGTASGLHVQFSCRSSA